ncbi:MAG: carboxylesterase family protein [Alistipes sp.]|nr:carboxylesterase family protein [Alistipes sp.]
MKRYILTLIIALTASANVWAEEITKHTHLYAVKGADSLYLDHYVAPVEGKRPCMIFVFGGGFSRGERCNELYLNYFKYLTKQGLDVVSIDYRLGLKKLRGTGTAGYSIKDMVALFNNTVNMAVEDLFSATLYIMDNAEEWNIDTTNILTSGSSAGAITVLQAEHNICNKSSLAAMLPEGFNYAGVISFAGAIFSTKGTPKWDSQPAPIMLFHGDADTQVPYDKASLLGVGFYGSKFLSEEFEKRGWSYWFYSITNDTHNVAGTPMYDNLNEIATFIKDFAIDRRPLQITTMESDGKLPERKKKFKVMDYVKANYGG